MLSNHIKHLLNKHSRVIVPDLGAFMLKGDLSQSIYFNEFLRFNDGILIDYIAEQEKIDKDESTEKVKKFVDQINQHLSTSKSAELEGLGVLFIDSNDKIQLKPLGLKASEPASIQVEKDTGPREIFFEIEKTEPITSVPPEVKPTAKPAKKAKAQTTTKPADEAPEKQVQEVTSIEAEQPVQPAQPAKSTQSGHSTQASKHQPHQSSQPQRQVEKAKTSKSRAGIVWLGVVIVAVLGAIIYFAFFSNFFKETHVNQNIIIGGKNLNDSVTNAKDSVSKTLNSSTVKTNAHNVAKIENPSEEQPKSEISKKHVWESVTKNEITKSAVSTGKRYYLVAGCFSVEANANKLVTKLNSEGFQAEKFVRTKNNLYYVSYSSYTSNMEASQAMNRLKSAGKSNVWILNY